MTTVPETFPVVRRADHVPGAAQGCWTYDAYAQIPEDGHRYEIADGVLYMAAAPNFAHQATVLRIGSHLLLPVEFRGLGRVIIAPFDVELPNGDLYQPDVVVVLNANLGIITPSRIRGTPDLIVEVASPGTSTFDRSVKLASYQRAGAPEYWLVGHYARTVELLRLDAGRYTTVGIFHGPVTLPSAVLADLPVTVDQFFA